MSTDVQKAVNGLFVTLQTEGHCANHIAETMLACGLSTVRYLAGDTYTIDRLREMIAVIEAASKRRRRHSAH